MSIDAHIQIERGTFQLNARLELPARVPVVPVWRSTETCRVQSEYGHRYSWFPDAEFPVAGIHADQQQK